MDPDSERATAFNFCCIPLPFGRRKAKKERIKPGRDTTDDPTPAKALVPELDEEKAEVARLEQESQRAKAKADGIAEAKSKLEDELRKVKELLETREKDLADKDASLQQLGKAMSEMQGKKLTESQSTAARIQELSTRLEEKSKLLTEKTMELNAAQKFLTKVDTVSETEVVEMVEKLNTFISTITSALDSWDHREPVPGTLPEEFDMGQIRDTIGSSMLGQIAARNPVAVNLAVQMTLGHFIERVTSSWGGEQAAGTLAEIYETISKENQTIASRWRTLTKRHIPRQEPPQDEEVMGDLARILLLTGSFSDFSEVMESVRSSAGTEVNAIIEATLKLDDTIKTKIASSDISVYIVPPGTIFDKERMTDEFGEGGIQEGEESRIVAGTTEIGLLQKSDVEKVLRKPKVILEKDLVEPEDRS